MYGSEKVKPASQTVHQQIQYIELMLIQYWHNAADSERSSVEIGLMHRTCLVSCSGGFY